jgi:ligand-binding sensor domain-containing protein
MQKFTTILCFLLACVIGAAAQLSETDFEKYNTASGLTGNEVRTLLQDSRGFLWVGTASGLNRFDGRTIKQYNSIGAKGLTDLTITGITEDAEGNIWIGTQYGLNKLNPFTDTVTRYYEGSGPGTIPYRWCNTVYTDSEKNVWLATEKGIALYNKNTNSFTNYAVTLFGKDPKANRFINVIFEDSKKQLWLATSFGIKLFNRQNKTYQSFHFAETDKPNLRENVVLTLFEDEAHNLVAGTWGGGLLRFNAAAGRFDKAGESSSYLLNEQVNSIAQLQTPVNGTHQCRRRKSGPAV